MRARALGVGARMALAREPLVHGLGHLGGFLGSTHSRGAHPDDADEHGRCGGDQERDGPGRVERLAAYADDGEQAEERRHGHGSAEQAAGQQAAPHVTPELRHRARLESHAEKCGGGGAAERRGQQRDSRPRVVGSECSVEKAQAELRQDDQRAEGEQIRKPSARRGGHVDGQPCPAEQREHHRGGYAHAQPVGLSTRSEQRIDEQVDTERVLERGADGDQQNQRSQQLADRPLPAILGRHQHDRPCQCEECRRGVGLERQPCRRQPRREQPRRECARRQREHAAGRRAHERLGRLGASRRVLHDGSRNLADE